MSLPLSEIYRAYIACLNAQDWPRLELFVAKDVRYNGEQIQLAGYRQMLENDFRAIPDLQFNIEVLVTQPPVVGSRLLFNCTPSGLLFGMPVNGKRVRFAENVFYEFHDHRITAVWSVIDKASIAAQL